MNTRPLFIPVILGTVRKGRASENVAKFVFEQVTKREGVETEFIDIRELKFPNDDAGEQIKDPQFSATCARADGLVLVVPEYNHGYPGMLKHVLDSNLKEYIHKAAGIDQSPFWFRVSQRKSHIDPGSCGGRPGGAGRGDVRGG